MREITKTVSVPAAGNPMDFRLTKPDAFSGAGLLRIGRGERGKPLYFGSVPGARGHLIP